MDEAAAAMDQQALLTQLEGALQKERTLERELQSIDQELEALAGERTQHRLLHEACGALDELCALGAGSLFWDEQGAEGEQRVRRVRARVDAFQKRLGEIEERRDGVADALREQREATGWIEDDLDEAREREEMRKLEWLIEREENVLPARAVIMPWAHGGEDDQRFRKALATAIALSLLILLIVPMIEIPLPDLSENPIVVPERLTRLIVPPRPAPPPVHQETKPPEESPLLAEQAEPAKTKNAGPGKGTGEGPSKGPGKGILAFREQLSNIAENQRLARLGAQAHVTNAGAASGVVERSMVTTNAPGSSGGINLGELSRGLGSGGTGGGSAIAGVQIARATSTIAGGSGGGGAAGTRNGAGAIAGRTDEEIQIVFDRHKAALYRLYNRELRRDPTLRGQMILRLRIEPDGSVSICELKGSDMNAPQLAAQVVERVHAFDFGAKEGIGPVTILYPIDFLPAG
jgi:hypothetical protein